MESNTNPSKKESSKKKNRRTWFDWLQLTSTILIPIIIAIYTIVDTKSNASIADANRRQDLEIAEAKRHSDLEIAEAKRHSDLEIAEANRLHEIQLSEQSREKDRALSIDQQQETILIQYQTFLSNLILEYGNNLEKTPEAKTVAQVMTLTALDQLNVKRKSILLRSLHRANLINFLTTEKSFKESIVNLEQSDLSFIQFGLSSNQTDRLPTFRYIKWDYLWLPHTTLVNASFRYTLLDHTTFTESIMDSVDMSFAAHTSRQTQTNFVGVSLIQSNLSNVQFRLTDFSSTNLFLSQMDNFECIECNFSSSILTKVNLNYSRIFHLFHLSKNRLLFDYTNFSAGFMYSATFKSIDFIKSDWSNVQASQIGIYNSTFIKTILDKSSFIKSTIHDTIYDNVNFYKTDFSYSKLYNVTFINSNMYDVNMSFILCDFCSFTNINFENMIWTNISLRYSKLHDCSIDINDLLKANSYFFNSKLINGTNESNLGLIDYLNRFPYLIRIQTGDRIPIETHLNVYLTIFGQTNQTEQTELKSNDYTLNNFQRGYIENFTYQFNNLGEIKSLRIQYYENTQRTKWFLNWIEIDIPMREEFYKFDCFCWINKSQITNQYQIELRPSEIIQKNILVTYEVSVYRDKDEKAAIMNNLYLLIFGEYRNSDTYQLIQLKTNSKPYGSYQIDIFHINSLSLGKLKNIDVWIMNGMGSPSLFLSRIEIRDTRINNSYFEFEFQNWIHNIMGNCGEFPRAHIPLSKYFIINDFTFFKISVITSDQLGSGTNANVYIIIFDLFKNTGKISLDKSRTYTDPFESGHRDEFYVELNDFDQPIKIKIGHDNSGFGPDWSLDSVEIERSRLNKKWIFPYGKKLTQLNEKNQIEIELYPKTNSN